MKKKKKEMRTDSTIWGKKPNVVFSRQKVFTAINFLIAAILRYSPLSRVFCSTAPHWNFLTQFLSDIQIYPSTLTIGRGPKRTENAWKVWFCIIDVLILNHIQIKAQELWTTVHLLANFYIFLQFFSYKVGYYKVHQSYIP